MPESGLYERFQYRGVTLDRMTIAGLHAAEKRLGYAQAIIQGSYHGGVDASGGTHDGGGAVDLVWVDVPRKVRAHRKTGWAFSPRPALPGVWSKHCHAIQLGNDKASPAAKDQMRDYRAGRNGLADGGPDRWWRPRRIRDFSYSRANLISWKRLNGVAKRGGKPLRPGGAREVEVVARALEGFNMNLGDHVKGRMDLPLIKAIERFRDIRGIGHTEVAGPLNPKTCYALCIPTREEN